MSHSFVRRAPAIAEEILAKTASLPESLKSFSKDLLNKEASVASDRLELPKRMTLDELSKLASGNRADLPKVDDVNLDDYSKVASELLAIAKREETKEAAEIYDAAVTVALMKPAAHEEPKLASEVGQVAGNAVRRLALPVAVGAGALGGAYFLGRRAGKKKAEREAAEVGRGEKHAKMTREQYEQKVNDDVLPYVAPTMLRGAAAGGLMGALGFGRRSAAVGAAVGASSVADLVDSEVAVHKGRRLEAAQQAASAVGTPIVAASIARPDFLMEGRGRLSLPVTLAALGLPIGAGVIQAIRASIKDKQIERALGEKKK